MRLLRRVPFTLGLLLVLVGVAVLTGTHLGPIDPRLRRLFGFAAVHLPEMAWYRVFTSLVLTTGGATFYAVIVQAALFVGAAELLQGTRRTAAVFLGVHVLTLIVLAFLVALPLASAGVVRGELLAKARDVGPSAGYFGCLGLALAALPRPARTRLLSLVLVVLAARFAWSYVRVPEAGRRMSADSAHVIALPLGFLAARIRRPGASPPPASPRRVAG